MFRFTFSAHRGHKLAVHLEIIISCLPLFRKQNRFLLRLVWTMVLAAPAGPELLRSPSARSKVLVEVIDEKTCLRRIMNFTRSTNCSNYPMAEIAMQSQTNVPKSTKTWCNAYRYIIYCNVGHQRPTMAVHAVLVEAGLKMGFLVSADSLLCDAFVSSSIALRFSRGNHSPQHCAPKDAQTTPYFAKPGQICTAATILRSRCAKMQTTFFRQHFR